jgi:hypothetical protein
VPLRRTLAAAFVLATFTLAGIACAFVAFIAFFPMFAFNDGTPRLGWLAAAVFMLIVSVGVRIPSRTARKAGCRSCACTTSGSPAVVHVRLVQRKGAH